MNAMKNKHVRDGLNPKQLCHLRHRNAIEARICMLEKDMLISLLERSFIQLVNLTS